MTRKKTGRSTRAKHARRAARSAKQQARSTTRAADLGAGLPPGWRDAADLAAAPDSAFANPFDDIDPDHETSMCPVDDHCAGCGSTGPLHVMLSAFSSGEIACATVCPACDSTSMLHLREIGPAGIDARVVAHQQHRNALTTTG